MNLKTRAVAAAVLTVLGVSAAQASVLYNFVPDAGSAVTGGQLIVTDAAYRHGSVSLNLNPSNPELIGAGDAPYLNAPVLSATIFGSLPGDGGAYYYRGSSLPPSPVWISTVLTFNDNGTLSGNMLIHSESSNIQAQGFSQEWSVDHYHSDYCIQGDPCYGQTSGEYAGLGMWQLDPATVPVAVPEPSSLGLFGLALIGIAGVAYRRRNIG